ncbi:MAG: DUF3473 domain-containing protein [Calditrichaeota bacterium]|nr:DUF3473 domain-containing protein [Calditrichota bacterium]
MKNILTVDVEEWFHPEALQHLFPVERWKEQPARVEPLVDRLLELFAKFDARATFFVLGWVAEQHPKLIRRIVEAGHEVASHSYGHRMVTKMKPAEFREDLQRSVQILQNITGKKVSGFRAPTFSITRENLWAFDILTESGLLYDSSIYPIWHDRYGVPDAPRTTFIVEGSNGSDIYEFPMPTLRILGKNFPFGGGGYLRIFPLKFTTLAIKKFNRQGFPAIIYMHPWEFDRDQPRLKLGRLREFRHYGNISKNIDKLSHLLKTFEWVGFADYLKILREDKKLPIKKLNLRAV